MPFGNITIVQSKPVVLTGASSPITASFDSPITSGNLVAFIGVGINGSSDIGATLGTPTGGGTWANIANGRSSGSYGPSAFGAFLAGASGSPSFSFPFTDNGVAISGGLRVAGVLVEINAQAASYLDGAVKTGSGAVNSTSTSISTGALAQTDNLLLGVVALWSGMPGNPAGWTSLLSQSNGSTPGVQVSWQKTTAVTNTTFTVSHTAAPGVPTSGLLWVIKAIDVGTFIYEFQFPSSGTGSMPSNQGTIRAVVARNRDPFTTGSYEYYNGLTAATGTAAGDSTTRLLTITSVPNDVALTDTLRASFETADANSGSVGWIPGTVKGV